MNIIEQTLRLLEVDPEFIVKDRTAKSKELTARDLITKVVNDEGNTKISNLFKGFDQIKVRKAFSLVFYKLPKPSPSTEWYLYILSINGLKKCPACSTIKALTDFSQNKAMKTAKYDSWCKSCTKEYRDINSASISETKANWQKNNPTKTVAATARRRAVKLNAAVSWGNAEAIQKIYDNCPEGYHVDHWAPLQGELICGLHVEFNLQYLKAGENISKNNNFSDSDPYYGY